MRNVQVIDHISREIAASLRAAGADVPTLAPAELERRARTRPRPWPTRDYYEAARPAVRDRIFPQYVPGPFAPDTLPPLSPEEEGFLAGELYDLLDVLVSFDRYIGFSCIEAPHRAVSMDEDSELEAIPARFRPGSRRERMQAEDAVAAAFFAREAVATGFPEQRLVVRAAARYMPPGFVPARQAPAGVWTDRALTGWDVLRAHRGELVLAAEQAGVTPSRIRQLRGEYRATAQ